jgi:hypothetical protein
MYVCAQLFISYVCMCSVIYNLCMYVQSFKLKCCYIVIYWIWCKQNKDNKMPFMPCMCSVIYKLCMYVIYWIWCQRNKDNYNVPVIFNSQA